MNKTCSRCGEVIIWQKSNNDRWIPMNKNGSCHFDTCKFASEFRGKKRENIGGVDYTKPAKPPDKNQKVLDEYKNNK